jgi:acetyl esterase/lipase
MQAKVWAPQLSAMKGADAPARMHSKRRGETMTIGFSPIRFAAVALLLTTFLNGGAASQPPSPMTPQPIAPPREPLGAIPLQVASPSTPGAAAQEQWLLFNGEPSVTNVSHPTLTPLLPKAGKGTRAAVIVAPGGGFFLLAMQHEGWNVARWIADHGIAAFVLKYRLRPFAEAVRPSQGPARRLDYGPALEDMKVALHLVQSRAPKWNIDPNRVEIMGFSAGARLALSLATARLRSQT